ncbi:methyltransferase domain-containing protein [Sneathiella chungangensis]|uniref:Methyltransferase domain-containing protein n=1 Tax=Sneathiella chungangensis TaxID=1418234 RepID=A0A845ME38_9PROT|nr:class I SAM-dependent methyltransferase [Sneathiella chungangensis]MZR21324.1 methyltransferase domain-containing protein [Sneathiella chungangensis]
MTLAEQQWPDFDGKEAEEFGEKLGDIINSGAIAFMISVGHKTGLFDSMADAGPLTSAQIAARAGLKERYVREWLAVMVTGGIVLYEPGARLYKLPAAHAASLTRGGALGNFAVYAQFIPMTGAIEDKLIDCFKTGQGMKYEDYPCFHQVMSEDSDQTVVANIFDLVLPLEPGLKDRLDAGIDVLDAGCGRGHALTALAERFPKNRFVGYDLCVDAIEAACDYAADAGVENIRFEARDLTDFDDVARFDLITTFDAVHDQKHPADYLKRLRRALRPGGVHLMQDIGGSAHLENNLEFPMAAFLYTASCAHCMAVSLGQGGDGLGTMWGWETAERMLKEAGYRRVERHMFEEDPMNVWFVSKA